MSEHPAPSPVPSPEPGRPAAAVPGRADEAGAPETARAERRRIDRGIAHLAIPALGALVAEPLFLLVDSALVGHLGMAPLAGLAVAGAILQTAVGLMVFLAYSTTPLVARRRGAGDLRGAVQAGVDGLWLALGIGIVVGIAIWLLSGPLIAAFGVAPDTAEQARIYLTVSCLGIPAMLVVFAASGLLRGLQDTRTPLAVATIGFAINAILNVWFILGLGFGIAGSAWGTIIAQWGMVAVYLIVIARHARRAGAGFLPHRDGLGHAGRSGGWLFIRTLGLRAALLSTVFAATSHGTAATAGYQVVFTIFSTAAFALDALAIAAQALIGDALGASDARRARLITRRSVFWGIACGAVIGGLLAATSPVLGRVFTGEAAVLEILPPALLVLGISLPLGGLVFVLDGVLMGAGDARYLAWTSMVNLAVYLPILWLLTRLAPSGAPALVALTAGFTIVFMLARAVTLGLRARSERWVRLGV
ncbi:MATE family efflux transporter [Leucobacter chromiireducens]|uniref:MATE family efflux transporter n=1 Tax=Leucobacter chromiireducens subsp. solipictus TaxID=398235 RepID=A0ABS1SJ76_9MICO|nr:MATE family efflux transporter [Leucobacter chromiireducens]MBL3680575.1 MATE family efflux transporter [Leucobacter chromiireducens subsp. solipictus]